MAGPPTNIPTGSTSVAVADARCPICGLGMPAEVVPYHAEECLLPGAATTPAKASVDHEIIVSICIHSLSLQDLWPTACRTCLLDCDW